MLLEIRRLDDIANSRDLNCDEWAHRYKLETELQDTGHLRSLRVTLTEEGRREVDSERRLIQHISTVR